MNMENGANRVVFKEQEEEEDVLSLCNLPMQESSSSSPSCSPRAISFSSAQQFFQFDQLSNPDYVVDDHEEEGYFSAPEIIFCGKIIHQEQQQNEYQKRDYLNLRKPDPILSHNEKVHDDDDVQKPRSSPSRTPAKFSYHQQHQKVNITALTSMSAKSRRRMFMFGPVKFKPEMDLSAIKERQGKRLTTLLSPETKWDGANAVVVNDGGKTTSTTVTAEVGNGKTRRGQWGLLKATLRGRAHLSNVLARSFVFGCIPAASAGRNWIEVPN